MTVRGAKPHLGAAPKARYVSGWVVSGDALRSPGLQTVDVLRASPGVQVTQTGGFGAPATASLRGATAAQTPVYFAGIRLNDEVGGAANLADVPLFFLDRVEVYRSHAPLVADRLGIGGAIFLEPKRPRAEEAGLGAMAGSFGSRSGHAYVGAGGNDDAVLAAIQLFGAENDYSFDDDRGTLYRSTDDRPGRLANADVTGHNVWLGARSSRRRACTTLVGNLAEREQGAVKLATVPAQSARNRFRRTLVGLSSAVPLGGDSWHGSLEARTAIVTSETEIDDPLRELGLLSDRTRTPGDRVEQTVSSRQQFPRLALIEQLSASIERIQRFGRSGGVSELELSAHRGVVRAAFGAEYELFRGLFVDGAGAGECTATATGTLGGCDALAGTGRLGASVRAESYELYLNLGRYHRPPTLSELYGVSLLVRGNEELVPELGGTAELGGRWQWLSRAERRLLWIDAAAFARGTQELLTYVRTAQGTMRPVNRDRSRALGTELGAGMSPWRWLEGELTLSLLDPRDTSPARETVNDILPFQSRLVASARVRLEVPIARGPWEGVGITAHGTLQSSRYADPAGLGVIPAQNNLDLEVDMELLDEHLRAALRIGNLLDARRFDIVGYPLPGRSGFFSLETRL